MTTWFPHSCLISCIQVGEAPFTFAPTLQQEAALKANMVQAVLPSSFKNLKNATFGVASSTTTQQDTVLSIDTVKHVNYS